MRRPFDFNKNRALAILVDPDEGNPDTWVKLANQLKSSSLDYIFIGGSFLVKSNLKACIHLLRNAEKPLILFPGSSAQVDEDADGILLLSLISGRNPELLIGQHVQAAMNLKATGLPIIPTGYLLIDGGKPTTVSYISNTNPIPFDKPGIAAATALAGEQLGMKLIYLDAGSGAERCVSAEMISTARSWVQLPIVVGGGIRDKSGVEKAWSAGANIVVVGNHVMENPSFLSELLEMKRNTIFN
jgi:phosphoglycerol geranylgeranyltransferase